jgi:antitoxin component of MazEF toxin-antitoxin module
MGRGWIRERLALEIGTAVLVVTVFGTIATRPFRRFWRARRAGAREAEARARGHERGGAEERGSEHGEIGGEGGSRTASGMTPGDSSGKGG